MFNESRDMWKKFDDDFRNMACMSNNIMLESCRISDLASDWLTSFSRAASSAPLAEDSSMMLLDMHAMFLKSSSNFFHMSLDSLNMASRTLSKSSQVFLKM